MEGVLKQLSCDPVCGFLLKDHDEAEIMDLGMRHVKNSHPDMNVTSDQLKGMIKNA